MSAGGGQHSGGGGRPPSFASTPLPPIGTPRRQGPNGPSGIHNTPYQRTGTNQSPIQPISDRSTLDQLLSELRRGLDEQKKVKEDVRRVGLAMNRIEESVRQLGEELKQHTEQSFSIESSQYKDGLLKEVSVLYCKSLKRLPEREDVGRCIFKVLQDEAKVRTKFNKAKTFCSNRLIDLRSEERRRVFGNSPCGVFPSLRTAEFADRFLNTIKAPGECRDFYIKHLALLRKFVRESIEASSDTFKKFRDWLDQAYALGYPSDEEWEGIMRDDEDWQYNPVETSNLGFDSGYANHDELGYVTQHDSGQDMNT